MQRARIVGGEIRWHGTPIGPIRERRTTRAAIAQIFQNPRASLNPIRAIGQQLSDVAGKNRVASLLESVRLEANKAHNYPVRALGRPMPARGNCPGAGCEPELLIADEPTTGLDVTTEATIMKLIGELSRMRGMATLLVTHNLALAAAHCHRIVVMHAGQIVESAPVAALTSSAAPSLLGPAPGCHATERRQARRPARHPRPASRPYGLASAVSVRHALPAASADCDADSARTRSRRSPRPPRRLQASAVLTVSALRKVFHGRGWKATPVLAVDDISFDLARGRASASSARAARARARSAASSRA